MICKKIDGYFEREKTEKEVDRQRKWDLRFLELAKTISTFSYDPSTKVGSVIVNQKKQIISMGFNGFPQRTPDNESEYNNREIKLRKICHAELSAIIFARQDLTGCTLYTFPMACCENCTKYVIQSGISRVVFPKTNNERWLESIEFSKKHFNEAGVYWTEIIS